MVPIAHVPTFRKTPGQLIISTRVCSNFGEEIFPRILVDTGAQPNLVKEGLFAHNSFFKATKPLQLVGANKKPIFGGRRMIKLHFTFRNPQTRKAMRFSGLFYEAEIILSNGWMAENKLLPVPEFKKLAVRDDCKIQILEPLPPPPEVNEIDTRPHPLKSPTSEATTLQFPPPPEDDEFLLDYFSEWTKVRKHQLLFSIPENEDGTQTSPLSTAELRVVAEVLKSHGENFPVCSLVSPEEPSEHPLATKLKEKLYEDYKDTVFRPEIYSNPQPRGPSGMATITLKPNAIPIYKRAIPCHGDKMLALRKILDKWKEQKKIEPPLPSGWGSPMFLVPKPNKPEDPWRAVIDDRAPNSAAERDSYTIPLIGDILVRQGQKVMWSVLDLKDAFSQIPLAPESRPIFKITTPIGDFQPTVMPQGYTNAPSIFQREMDFCLEPVQNLANAYFDDIIAGTDGDKNEPEEEILKRQDSDLRKVLDVLKEGRWVLDFHKCTFFSKRVEFCGFVLEGGTRRISPGRLRPIENWPVPRDVTSLRAYLGFTNHYQEFVPNYAELTSALHEKLKLPRALGKKGSKHKIDFSEKDLENFEKLRQALLDGFRLKIPDPSKPFIIRTDACDKAIGGVLEQLAEGQEFPPPGKEDEVKTIPVAFFSRKLSSGQAKTWPVREKEAYAIVAILKKFGSLIGHQPVLILTDHKSLENWTTEILDIPGGPTSRRARWHILLSHFKLEVRYIKGQKNEVADSLSRWAYPACLTQDCFLNGTTEDEKEVAKRKRRTMHWNPPSTPPFNGFVTLPNP